MVSGRNHNLLLIRKNGGRFLYAFGEDVGVGIDKVPTCYVPQLVQIKEIEDYEDISTIYTRYNTNVAVDKKGRLFMWGEDSSNFRLSEVQLFHTFNDKVKQLALGKKHGLVLDGKGIVHGWGDGTYGEVGIISDFGIEKPVPVPFFKNKDVVQIVSGARHNLVLCKNGNLYAMGDNSEEQCGILGVKAIVPELIVKNFTATKVYAGDTHNIAIADNGLLYNWGGMDVNTSRISTSMKESKLKPMEELKDKEILQLELAYLNTIIVVEDAE